MHHANPMPPADRLTLINQARHAVLANAEPACQMVPAWINRSWQRCLAQGKDPAQRLAFGVVQSNRIRHTIDANQPLLQAARPIVADLAQAVADTQYFALLTDAHGTVIDVNGPIDRQGTKARALARIGVDLSEQAVGTTAIGAALTEHHPVWLHRGEHFFHDTSSYSCAGAPVFDPDGICAGMLDLTGIDVPERPALRHLVALSAKRIENAWVLSRPHRLMLRVSWPGQTPGSDTDGLLTANQEGQITGFNPTAADMLGLVPNRHRQMLDDVFAAPVGHLFDQAQHGACAREWPLWSGLRVQVLASMAGADTRHTHAHPPSPQVHAATLKDVETDLIRQAVNQHRGNVAAAAQALGISRATVYRKIAPKR
jgi:transcriptional regulator of acetoin/glycerol metabolism